MESDTIAMTPASPSPKKRGRPAQRSIVESSEVSDSTLTDTTSKGSAYFPDVKIERIPTGSHLLDLILNGGWAIGRIANLVGDRSTGKSLLSIEACANFARVYPNGRIVYIETEFAFDKEYAVSLGLPLDNVSFPNEDETAPAIDTIEKLSTKLDELINDDFDHETLVVVDSLDALSDEAEMSRKITDASFGSGKAKKMSEMFRRLNASLSKKKFAVIIVSQVRDNIGAMFGEKHTRSGGRALDFYSSQIVWLANTGRIEKTREKSKRVIGVNIKAKCKKNKTGLPFRECEFPIYFNFGVEDLVSCLEFLEENEPDSYILDKPVKKYLSSFESLSKEEYSEVLKEARKQATNLWIEIEGKFSTSRKKYE